MELRQMEHFLSVAEWNSFTVAAEKAYISQSALSRSIGDLEFELGVKLFIRSKTTVTLTSEGELLLPIAREMLTTKSRFHQCAKSFLRTARAHCELDILDTGNTHISVKWYMSFLNVSYTLF